MDGAGPLWIGENICNKKVEENRFSDGASWHITLRQGRLTLTVLSMPLTAINGKVGCCSITKFADRQLSHNPRLLKENDLPFTTDPSPSQIPSSRPVSLSQTKKYPSSEPDAILSDFVPKKLPDHPPHVH